MSGPDWVAVHAAFRPAVHNVVRRVLRDSHEAEDAVQDAFLRAMTHIDSLRDTDALPAWLLKVARHAALDLARRRRRAPQVSDILEERIDDRQGLPQDAVEAAEAFARLLPWMQRSLEYRSRGLSFAQAAQAEGISVPAARTRLTRARARLRTLLEP